MICITTFKKTLEFFKEQRQKFESLRQAAENISPGEYINFMPEFVYENIIVDILAESFAFNCCAYDPATHATVKQLIKSEIDYFICDLNFGEDPHASTAVTDLSTNTPIDLSSIDKLYHYLVSIVKKHTEIM